MMKASQTSRKKPEQSSGAVTIQDDEVVWHNADLVFAIFNLSDVAVIGEHTNSSGPWFDDWFLDVVTKDGRWFSIPWYADNIEELTRILSDRFQQDLNTSFLTNSTTWASVIRYPGHLKSRPLFKVIPTKNFKAPKTVFDKMLFVLGMGRFDTTKTLALTEEVDKELTSSHRHT